MAKITWKTEKRKVADLLPAAYNPRKMTESERRDLEASIKEFGAVIPIVVNIGKRDRTVIGGHQRTKIYADLGIEDIDVMVPSRELTLKEEKTLNLRLNKNTGSWDMEKLQEMEMDMLLDVGFGDEDLQLLFDDVDVLDDEFDVDKAVDKAKKEVKCALGDIWQLGDHKLMIGDSTQPEQVLRLMGKDLADVILSDPPYNIGLDYNKGISTSGKYEGKYGGHSRREDAGKFPANKFTSMKMSDSKTVAKYSEFIDTAIKTALAVTKPNAHVFYWCDEKYIWLLQTIFESNKIDNKRVCMWIKNNFNMTPQIAFNKVYEPCVYGTTGQPFLNKNMNNLNEILNKEVGSGNQVHEEILDMINLWVEKRDNAQEYTHPTQKPVTLSEKPLKRCSAPGHIVLDSFAGSGSSMIACQQLNRKWRGVEQDPIFGTVIIDRYEAFTNLKARKL